MKNKQTHLLLSIMMASLITFCTNKLTQYDSSEIVKIEYSEPVEGFKVKIIWVPSEIINGFAKGPAILELFNIKDSIFSKLTSNSLAIKIDRLPFEYNSDSTEIKSVKPNVKITYAKDLNLSNEWFGTSEEPFFFQDVNFDNNKDLILVEFGTGQRGVNNYRVDGMSNSDLLKEPFLSLDDYSKIDYKNRTITLVGSNGACDRTTEIYKQKKYEVNEYGIKFSYYEIEQDTLIELKDCKTYTYKVSKNKTLISVTQETN
jgi:hypothetical protein